MNIINKLTLENLKKNKKRTMVTIIGVILSTALICAVAGMVMSFKQTMIGVAIADDGDFHVEYENVPTKEIKYIEKNVGVDSYFYSKNLGFAKLENNKNEYKPYISVLAMTDDALKKTGLKLVEGRMPENGEEIIISESILSNAGVKYKVGDNITLNLGKRADKNGEELKQRNVAKEDDESELSTGKPYINEEIVDSTSKTYKIVGIIKRPSSIMESYSAPAYTTITKLDNYELNKENEKYNVYVRYKVAKEWQDVNKKIIGTIKNDIGEEIDITKNKQLLEYEGAIAATQMNALYILAGIIIGIIIISSVFVIKNGFSISVTEKIKEFGMLSSVGATSKQIRKSVLFEGFVIGLIGIPLGIILGVVTIVILVQVLNLILVEEMVQMGSKFVYVVPLIVIGFSVLFGAITIFLSSIIPAIKASKISAIEAIRSNNDIKIKNKKLKTSKLTKKLFGIGGVIASKNLKRSKKKYRTTVVSLVVSIFIFISLSSFMEYGIGSSKLMFKQMDYNVSVSTSDENIFKEITKNNLVNDYAYYKVAIISININKYGTEYAKQIMNPSNKEQINNQDEQNDSFTPIYFVSSNYFKQYIKSLGLNENDSNKIAILQDATIEYNKDGSKTMRNYLNVKDGENIVVDTIINLEENKKGTQIEVPITKRTDKTLRGFENVYTVGGMIFVSEDYYQKDKIGKTEASGLYIKTDKANELETELTNLKKNNDKYKEIKFENVDTYMKQMDRMMLVVAIFLYGFIIVITLIGVTNIFNTITTNMILRKKEFAMLKSIGMTKKEFDKMIRLESIMYAAKSLIIGIPLGILGSYGIYKATVGIIDMGYKIPIAPIIISVIFVFIIVAITMKYSMKQINKQNIVETIRNDNI